MRDLNKFKATDIAESLNRVGYARIPNVLSADDCNTVRKLYDVGNLFRSAINMQRYRFGVGEYKYFDYPLPPLVESMRRQFYPQLVPVANGWMEKLDSEIRYPKEFTEFIDLCHEHDQRRPTPLLLHYKTGGYNTLHQDLYGDVYFPFQMVIQLTQPDSDFIGGELVFVEQLPRAQSKVSVLTPDQGEAIIFTTNFRPVRGTRGYYKAKMKHGVSPVSSGIRYTLGIIFHDAR